MDGFAVLPSGGAAKGGFQQVGGNREGVAAVRRLPLPAPGHKAAHAVATHQALDAAASHLLPVRPQGGVHPRAAIPAVTMNFGPAVLMNSGPPPAV